MHPTDALPPALSVVTNEAEFRAELSAVLLAAEATTGDRERAVELMLREPLRVFDGRTAVELVLEGRAREVEAYLESLSAGAAG